MELICPNCKRRLKPKNVNIETDLAKCEHCNSLHKASSLTSAEEQGLAMISNPPIGSSIELYTGIQDHFELYLPRKGIQINDIPTLVFTIFWLGFVSFWTWGAFQASIFFALFSIPFWFVGVTMLIGMINSTEETQSLEFDGEYLTLIKERPINSKTYEFKLSDIESVKIKHFNANDFSSFGSYNQQRSNSASSTSTKAAIAITSGARTEAFFERINDAEQKWVVKYMNAMIKNRK